MTSAPWWVQVPGATRALRDLTLARGALYYLEGLPLVTLNRALLGRWGKNFRAPPPDFAQATLAAAQHLIDTDIERASRGLFPLSLLKPQSPAQHLKSLLRVWEDGLKVAWRRRRGETQNLDSIRTEELAELPAYYRRNFHDQSEGYFSEASAARYDHQVELLFKGAAAPMRRLALVPLIATFGGQKAHLVELGCGTGAGTRMVAEALPSTQISAMDLSRPYLNYTRKNLGPLNNVDLVHSDATDTPFKDNFFAGAFSIFLFHELPAQIRLKVLSEAWRVLKPGGTLVLVDSIQWNDVPALNWGLEQFPKDFHEPFYANYIRTPLESQLEKSGFQVFHRECGLFSKCLAAKK